MQGTVLFRKGAASNDGMFSVVSGELGVFAEDDLGAGGAASPSIGPLDVPPRPTAGGGHRRGFSFDMALRAQTQRRTLLYVWHPVLETVLCSVRRWWHCCGGV